MDVVKEDVPRSLHQHMDELMKERDQIYRQHENELKRYQEELQKLEGELADRKKELLAEEERLLETKKLLEAERTAIAVKQEELKRYRERIAGELEFIRKEKLSAAGTGAYLPMEPSAGEQPREMFQEESGVQMQESSAGEPETNPQGMPQEAELKEQREVQEKAQEEAQEGAVPEILKKFADAAEQIFPQREFLELTKDAYCMNIEDKEIRILAGTPLEAVILAKREKNVYLMKGISQLNRLQQDWQFSYQNNCLKCVMPFTETVPVETVLKKCAEAVLQYFK